MPPSCPCLSLASAGLSNFHQNLKRRSPRVQDFPAPTFHDLSGSANEARPANRAILRPEADQRHERRSTGRGKRHERAFWKFTRYEASLLGAGCGRITRLQQPDRPPSTAASSWFASIVPKRLVYGSRRLIYLDAHGLPKLLDGHRCGQSSGDGVS